MDMWSFAFAASIAAAEACGEDTKNMARPPDSWEDVLQGRPELRSHIHRFVRVCKERKSAQTYNRSRSPETSTDRWRETGQLMQIGMVLWQSVMSLPNYESEIRPRIPPPGQSHGSMLAWLKGLFSVLVAQHYGNCETVEAKKVIEDFMNDLRTFKRRRELSTTSPSSGHQ
ncbi:hypothetical protein ONS95_013841 [Cadophora gregata]|uniref:uncharacterized protein n=1 Tax=Cadophora gregata TaxID=51156 RepID=UPI0026DD6D95|nr:uncharacterized protein ONS95_013841 [Cadophora gregata]KAK0114349.1 hypothetical protein ONS95_013841 [Cadophora gregata]